MTWQASTKRWFKKYRGQVYAVSCRPLKCPPAKEASAQAANAWGEAKQKEIDAAPPTEEDLRVNAFRVYCMVQDWPSLDEANREKRVDSIIGAGQYQKLKAQAEAMVEAAVKVTPPDRTVKAALRAAFRSEKRGGGAANRATAIVRLRARPRLSAPRWRLPKRWSHAPDDTGRVPNRPTIVSARKP
jgi:hypothetical protein